MANLDLKDVKFDSQGLVPVVAQDLTSGEVLMLAYGNAESLAETERTGELVLYSRSRKEIWHKGETSGNRLKVAELRLDCDGDAILAIVEPLGPACHTGNWSCFYRNILGEPAGDGTFPGRLWRYLLKRKGASPEESYTARLISRGPSRAGQKVGEEGVEVAIAAATKDREALVREAADLIYHLLVALISLDVPLNELWRELRSRHRPV